MGHAGAFTSDRAGSAERKIEALCAAGVLIAPNAHNVGELMREALRSAAH
jgi:succinyl-CoA synthetase alpha subunit